MDQQMLARLETMRKHNPQVGPLVDMHRDLDGKVLALNERTHLTPEEEVELARLKKEKLRIKDQLEHMLHARSA
jgi:uncharacterized protein YdcH (DUF465 family)